MADDLKELKSVLRALVVSSPVQMDVRMLLHDYRNIIGTLVPLAKYGYRDPVAFLKERCGDCFLFGASPINPVLTPIVPDTIKHIDQLVQKQKIPFTANLKSKRSSIPETSVGKSKNNYNYKTCRFGSSVPTVIEEHKKLEVKVPDVTKNTNYTIRNQSSVNYDNQNKTVTSNDVKNFPKKRVRFEEPLSKKDGAFSLSQNDDSGKHISSSRNSTNALQFEELKSEIMELITSAPQAVRCTDLIRLYRERYNRELNFTRFGYTSIISLVYKLEKSVQITGTDDKNDWLLQDRSRAGPSRPALLRAGDSDNALPGINFDSDMFPVDCMECIPSMSLADFRPGAMLEVIMGEVYSPSHFWLIRLGENYSIAMEDLIDEMTLYYNGEGRERVLARGAVRVGQYCSTLYDGNWHRSLIVKIVDSDTVKVRYVDYGTVDTVECSALRPLRRDWARLPAQAVRARLSCVRPSAAGQRWSHEAAMHFLSTVCDKHLMANVVAVDLKEYLIETLLIDTSGAEDSCVSSELIRAGYADVRGDSALRESADSEDSATSASASELRGRGPRRMRTLAAGRTACVRGPPTAPPAHVAALKSERLRLLLAVHDRYAHASPAFRPSGSSVSSVSLSVPIISPVAETLPAPMNTLPVAETLPAPMNTLPVAETLPAPMNTLPGAEPTHDNVFVTNPKLRRLLELNKKYGNL